MMHGRKNIKKPLICYVPTVRCQWMQLLLGNTIAITTPSFWLIDASL